MRFIWKILIINETKRALFVYPTIGLSCGRNFKYGYPYKVKVYSSISLICFLFFFCLSLACSKFFCVFATLWTSQMKCWQVGVAELKGGIWKLEQADDLIVRTNECAGNLINSQSSPPPPAPTPAPTPSRLLVHMLHLQCLKPKTHISWQNAHKVCRKGRRNGIGI